MRATAPTPTESTAPMECLDGELEQVMFSADNGVWHVARAWITNAAPPDDHPIVTGALLHLDLHIPLRFYGTWETHAKYGRQFKVQATVRQEPLTPVGIARYLATSGCPRLGAKTAEKLVDAFGSETMGLLREEPERIATLRGVSIARAKQWQAFFQDQIALERIVGWLLQFDIDPSLAKRLNKEFGSEAISIIQRNPYQLTVDTWGVGFKTADRMAMSMGWPRLGTARIVALWRYVLQQAVGIGHCYQTPEQMERAALKLLDGVTKSELREALLEAQPELTSARDLRWIAPDEEVSTGRWTLAAMDGMERGVARLIRAHQQESPPSAAATVDWPWLERKTNVSYADAQKAAIEGALQHPVGVITGGPGTGKTTILRGLLTWLKDHEQVDPEMIALAAPTARAAKRMEEVTGHPAQTIHRLLGVTGEGFSYGSDAPLPYDWVVVDETSMLDLAIAWSFWQAIAPATRVLWVGDENQLPSVGAGAVLKDVIASGAVPVYRLAQNFRSTSGIVSNAYRVLTGTKPVRTSEFQWREYPRGQDKDAVRANLVELLPWIQERWGFTWHDVQVLAPMRRGSLGTEALNQAIRDAVNPRRTEPDWVGAFGKTFRVGDRVTQTRNNYQKGVFNGDIGFVERVERPEEPDDEDEDDREPDQPYMDVRFGDTVVRYTAEESREVTLAYATTVHKAQGSEYPVVIMPLFWDAFLLCNRPVLYTALTRARHVAILLTEDGAMNHALRTAEGERRQTLLAAHLASA